MRTLCRILFATGVLTVAAGVTLFAGCSDKPSGGSGPNVAASGKPAGALLDEANEAKDKDDWKRALALVDSALADPKASAEEKAEAWQNKIVCEGRVNGDKAAIAALKKLEESKVEMTSNRYAVMMHGLDDGDRLEAAVGVLAAATERFKGDAATKEKFEKIAEVLAEKMAATGDTEGQAKLRALGYVSGKK